jgi:PhnB protein
MKINPYLTFNGKCREAMSFYQSCFGGELMLQSVAETPVAAQCPAGMQDQIMHSELTGTDFCLMATDMTPEGKISPGNDMAIAINFDSEKKIRHCYSHLAEEGRVIDPLKDSFWGSLFGVVQDKYGKVWMMDYGRNQNN